ncbi:autotransporter outer membrane beta-barrel domain-containing protein [Microvirga pudoricolor]|uniref:autotransporter outer membrane beta-barrel domain-containing protein n=1 Tax=Microvirga pudoricolor TaxID=2778729 RepID=UPI00194FBE66|nr:autotransporter outer membrane beta-barrel domain-containing protein [Microvirga pudoricolor]MBM6593591.1 autotransporter outer membrane beta-barrel domain-containing protein [Microvirga pudoricolor]
MANVTSPQDYQTAIDSTSTESQHQPVVSQAMLARTSMNHAMSCPIFVDGGTMIGESQCVWARVTGHRAKTFESRTTDGFTQNGLDFRVGAQWEVKQDWFLGATAAYSETDGSSQDGFTATDGKGGDVSIALKHQRGPWLIAGSFHLGYSSNDISNRFDVGDVVWNARANADLWTAAAKARVAYEFAFPAWYVRPYLDMDLIYTSMAGYAIPGDLFSLKVGRMQDWTLAVRPAVEIGTRIELSDMGWLRPYASIGFSQFSDSNLAASVQIYDDMPDNHAFRSTPAMPETLLDVGVGMQLFAHGKYELRGEYKSQIGDQFLSHDASLRLSIGF